MSLDGVIYVYPLPIEVTVAPDDSTIVTYGFSANATAGVAVTIYAEELQASASYNLYVSGRSLDGSVSSPSRIIRVVTTTARIIFWHMVIYSNASNLDNFGECPEYRIDRLEVFVNVFRNHLVSSLHRRRT